jgi:hypothetical protein
MSWGRRDFRRRKKREEERRRWKRRGEKEKEKEEEEGQLKGKERRRKYQPKGLCIGFMLCEDVMARQSHYCSTPTPQPPTPCFQNMLALKCAMLHRLHQHTSVQKKKRKKKEEEKEKKETTTGSP